MSNSNSNGNSNNQHNVWRTVAWTLFAVALLAFVWRATSNSNDLQLLLLGGLMFAPIFLGIGLLMGHKPRDPQKVVDYNTGYDDGHTEGWESGYSYALQAHANRFAITPPPPPPPGRNVVPTSGVVLVK